MFRFLVSLCLLSLGTGLVLTDKAQPAAAAKEDSVALAEESQDKYDAEEAATAAGVEATAGEGAEDKEELEQIKQQDAEGNKLSEADQKELEKTMVDEKVTSNSEEHGDPDDLPENSPEILAEEKAAAAESTADSDEPMEIPTNDAEDSKPSGSK